MAADDVQLINVEEAVHEQGSNDPHTLAPQEKVPRVALGAGLATLKEDEEDWDKIWKKTPQYSCTITNL